MHLVEKPNKMKIKANLAAKAKDAKAETSKLETQIDELVHALYGLTPEEIKIAEGAGT